MTKLSLNALCVVVLLLSLIFSTLTIPEQLHGSPNCFDSRCLAEALLNCKPRIYIRCWIDISDAVPLPTINSEVTIVGKCESEDRCVLDAKGRSRIFVVGLGGYLTLRDMELCGGYCTTGSAVQVLGVGAESPTSSGKLVVNNVKFFNNTATDAGGAISIHAGGSAYVSNSVFNRNKGTKGGAMYVGGSTILPTPREWMQHSPLQCGPKSCATFVNTEFAENSAIFGGAVYVDDSGIGCATVGGGQLDCTTCTFVNNTAIEDGGAILLAFLSNGSLATTKESAFFRNAAGGFGGDVAVQQGTGESKGAQFNGYTTAFGYSSATDGASIAVQQLSAASFTKCDFSSYDADGKPALLCNGSCNTFCPIGATGLPNVSTGFCPLPPSSLCGWIPSECFYASPPGPSTSSPTSPPSSSSTAPPPHSSVITSIPSSPPPATSVAPSFPFSRNATSPPPHVSSPSSPISTSSPSPSYLYRPSPLGHSASPSPAPPPAILSSPSATPILSFPPSPSSFLSSPKPSLSPSTPATPSSRRGPVFRRNRHHSETHLKTHHPPTSFSQTPTSSPNSTPSPPFLPPRASNVPAPPPIPSPSSLHLSPANPPIPVSFSPLSPVPALQTPSRPPPSSLSSPPLPSLSPVSSAPPTSSHSSNASSPSAIPNPAPLPPTSSYPPPTSSSFTPPPPSLPRYPLSSPPPRASYLSPYFRRRNRRERKGPQSVLSPPPPPQYYAAPKKKRSSPPSDMSGFIGSAPYAPPPPPLSQTGSRVARQSRHNGSSITGDPHFVGKHGERFDFHGKDGKNYCVVSDKNVHVNIRVFHGKRRRSTFISEIGILYKEDEILITTKHRDPTEHYDAPYQVMVNHVRITSGNNIDSKSGVSVTLINESVHINVPGNLDIVANIMPATFGKRGSLHSFINFNVKQLKVSPQVHGVLGQTYQETRRTYQKLYDAKGTKRSRAAAILVDGSEADYATSDVLKPDCKFAVFKANRSWSKKVGRAMLEGIQRILFLSTWKEDMHEMASECSGFAD